MRMDLAVIAYILVIPLLLTGVYLFLPLPWLRRVEYRYLQFFIVVLCLILSGNIALFKFWGSLINYRALSYLQDFGSILSSLSAFQAIALLASTFLIIIIALRLFGRLIRPQERVTSPNINRATGFTVMAALSVLFMRGGLQMLPMNESLVSFSDNLFINQSTMNPAWYLVNDIVKAGLFRGNPLEPMPEERAKERVDELFEAAPDSFPHILTKQDPNIVFIILESFTADLVGAMGGEQGVSPNLDLLSGEGMLFDSIYSSGTRTDQGIVSLLNGWPATPYHSIMRSSEKTSRLPSLPKLFLDKGYETSFYYGGAKNFNNLNVYLTNQKFKVIVDEASFPEGTPKGRWGVPDGFVFDKMLNDLNASKRPFLSVIMTLSNHEPFDVPGDPRIKGESEPDKFRNSAAYTDAMLGQFIASAEKEPWFENTLFIIAADHGHSLPLMKNVYNFDSHRIPLLFFGPVLRPEFRGTIVHKLGGHHDVPGTLLPQLGLSESKNFNWSKNLLNPTSKPFAYYQIDHLLGWVDPDYWYGYSYNRNKFIGRSFSLSLETMDSLKMTGQAFVQELYGEYKSY